jgi:RNA polymerase sigma factor (sigma-70 family)
MPVDQPGHRSSTQPDEEPKPCGQITLVLDAIRLGEKRKVGELFQLVRERLHRRAFQLLPRHPAVSSKEEADDIVSQLWGKLELALLPCDPKNSGEFFRVANHKMHQILIDLSRKYRGPGAGPLGISVRTEPPDLVELNACDVGGPPRPGVATWVVDTEQVRLLWAAIDRLDETDKQLVQYTYYQEMSAVEIGSIMQLGEKTIRRRQQRVKKILKDTMRQIGDEIDLAPGVL